MTPATRVEPEIARGAGDGAPPEGTGDNRSDFRALLTIAYGAVTGRRQHEGHADHGQRDGRDQHGGRRQAARG